MKDYEFAIDELRHMVKSFDSCNESVNTRFTLEQLVKIHRAWMASGWDFCPDQWTERQIEEALSGIAPQWDPQTGQPVFEEEFGTETVGGWPPANSPMPFSLGRIFMTMPMKSPRQLSRATTIVWRQDSRILGIVSLAPNGTWQYELVGTGRCIDLYVSPEQALGAMLLWWTIPTNEEMENSDG